MYKADHIKVFKVLAEFLPKRLTLKTKYIVEKAFKNYEDGDRRVRNAYRKMRTEGHVEIVNRGEYRLTTPGAAFCRKLKKNSWKVPSTAARLSHKAKSITKKKKASKKRPSGEIVLFSATN